MGVAPGGTAPGEGTAEWTGPVFAILRLLSPRRPKRDPARIPVSHRYRRKVHGVRSLENRRRGRREDVRLRAFERRGAIADYLTTGKDTEISGEAAAPSPIDLKYSIDGYNKFLDSGVYPAVEPPWDTLRAVNV